MSEITCPNCNTNNAADSLNCSNCGASLPVAGNHLESISDWIDQIADPVESESSVSAPEESEHLVARSKELETIRDDATSEGPGDELLDWLKDLEPDLETPASGEHDRSTVENSTHTSDLLDDWAGELSADQQNRIDDNDQSGYAEEPVHSGEDESGEAASIVGQTAPLLPYHEIEGIPEQLAAQSLPDWLQDEDAKKTESSVEPPFPSDFDHDDTTVEEQLLFDSLLGSEIDEEFGSASDLPEDYASSEQDVAVESANTGPDAAEDDWYSEFAGIDVDNELDGMFESDQWVDEKAISRQSSDLVPELSDESQLTPPLPSDLPGEVEQDETAIPDWLEALKPEELTEFDKDELIESAGILAGIKGVLPLSTSSPTAQKASLQVESPMSVEQRRQVALLKQLTTVEQAVEPSESISRTSDRFVSFRIIIGIVLIFVIAIGWFSPTLKELIPGLESPPIPIETEAAFTAIAETAGKPVLVAFEYTPAYADELDPVALAMLEALASNNSAVVTISQYAAAVPIAQRMTDVVPDLDSVSLGYLPGDATGLRRLGSCLIDDSSCETIPGLVIDDESQSILQNVGAIVVLTAERDSLVNWIEQVGTQKPVPVISGITQALSPMASPYLASNQLAGSLAGMPAAAAVAQLSDEGSDSISSALNSLTLAQWLTFIVLVIGALYFGIFDLAMMGNKKVETE